MAIAAHLESDGVDVLAADPEVTADDAGYRRTLDGAGFHGIPEIQPSRHRMALALPSGGDEAAVMDGIAKATRQRIRRAERDGVVVLRWDAATARRGGVRPGDRGRRRSPGSLLRAVEGHWRPARLRVRGPRRVHGLVAPGPWRGAPRLPRGARGCRGRGRAGRPRPLSTRLQAVDRPLRRPGRAPARPPGRDAPAALARDPAGPVRGPRGDGPRRRGRGGCPAGPASRASPPTGCTSTSGRSGPSGSPSPARRNAWHERGDTRPAARSRS